MKQDMTQDMKHNDMKRNNEMRDTVFTTRRHHGSCGRLLRMLFLLMMALGVGEMRGQITPTTDTDNPVYYLFQSFGNTGFYMRPNNNNTNAAVSTSNILTDDMKWYFLDSDESGYYYICDKDGNYLYFSKPSGSQSSRTWMELKSLDNNDTEHYKFSIAQNNTKGWDAYNIIPYGNADKYCLNKQGRNAGTNGVQVSNGWDDENSNWVIIPMTTYAWTLRDDCFRPYDSSNKSFYQIKSKVDASYYIKPGTTYVETSNTVDDDMIWYFEEASSDDFMTYYYIRLANDGKYLRYRSNAGGQDNAIELASHTGSETGDAEDRFQFIVVRGAVSNEPWNTTDISYNIVPKLLKRTNNNINFYCVSSNKGLGKPLKTRNDRASTDNKWTFVSVPFSTICANPTITFSNTTGKVSIITTTTRSAIYYTTDGSEPSSSNGTPYTAPFEVTEQTTIKAIVTRTDFSNSQVTTMTIDKVAAPTIVNTEASDISITSATNGATIYYTTDGSIPTTSSTPYTEPVTITAASVTIKAIAVKDGMINSAVSSESFAFACATPTISFDNTTNTVTIASETGSTIYYAYGSNDPADPTVDEGVAHGSSPVSFPISAKTYIKALAVKEGLSNSAVQSKTIDIVQSPVISSVSADGKVTLSCAIEGATIYYTIGDSEPADPTTASTLYNSPIENTGGKYIKAIAVKEGWIHSAVFTSSQIRLACALPVIKRETGGKFSISCAFPLSGVHIYYTTGSTTPADPTAGDSEYTEPVSISSYPIVVRAIAIADGYDDSAIAEQTINEGLATDGTYYEIASAGDFEIFATMVNNNIDADSNYRLTGDFSVSGTTAITQAFKGIFDGNNHTITNLSHPLFSIVEDGVVKNVTLKNVNISSSDDYVGAIAGIAQGYSRIYNCGILPNSNNFPEGEHPTVTTTGACAGGIVGKLDGDSRVINCYSYADVKAATTASGIVGYNNFASTAAVSGGKYTKLRTAVVNCMFYGNITEGSNQYGVYGGELITNAATTGISSYNYYRSGSTFTTTSGEPTAYNCSFPAEERYLTQVEFHRSLLNSNRELCGWWVGSDVAPNTLTTAQVQAIPKNASIMYKWVVDRSLAPYPILKPFGKYASVINSNAGGGGTLSVTVKSGETGGDETKTLYLSISDMNPQNNDYGYHKVQLPYYNTVFGDPSSNDWNTRYAGNYTGQVVTGWKITAVTGGTQGSFVANWESGYNFADRKCTDKDKYDVSGRVFAQGGYYYVPDGVTAITIEAYWGKAIYVRNAEASYDRVNITVGTNGTDFAPAGTRGDNVIGQTIQDTTIKGSLTATNIDAKSTVYDYALVLVGNIQESLGASDVIHATEATRGFTIMSADFDFDEEPDYCLEWQLGAEFKRQVISPVRFDFLPVVELGIAGKLHNSTSFYSLGCYRSKGHFEVTETAFIHFGQFEFELASRDPGPIILNGGIYDQYCRGRNGENTQNITYVILGGHIIMPSFTPGAHPNSGATYQTRHCAVNALGGDFTSFYLTGGFNEGITPYDDNPHCYIDGGHFGTIAAAYKEGIAGNVTWRINHALIDEFYGGGIMSQKTGDNYKIVKGSIDVVIDNSTVGKYCGGPKFGDMESGTTVTTSATNTTFTEFYGAGNGGTNYVQYAKNYDDTGTPPSVSSWNSLVSGGNGAYDAGKYVSKEFGYKANYDYEQINGSDGTSAGKVVNRVYWYSAQFATTNTGSVKSTLKGCTINTNFYGGGFLGGVSGNVTSILTNCTIKGSVYGAGYSASAGTVTIYNQDKTPPSVNVYTSMIKPQSGGTATTYYWTHDHGSTGSPVTAATAGEEHDYYYTEIPLDNLGAVNGDVTLTLDGSTRVECKVFNENGVIDPSKKGGVFGGGQASAVTGDTHKVTVNLKDNTEVFGNVFGGGDEGLVEGSTKVNIEYEE